MLCCFSVMFTHAIAAEGVKFSAPVESLAVHVASLAPGSMSMDLAALAKQGAMAFDSALPFLRTQLEAILKSPDAIEGITAFLEKREPKWDQHLTGGSAQYSF